MEAGLSCHSPSGVWQVDGYLGRCVGESNVPTQTVTAEEVRLVSLLQKVFGETGTGITITERASGQRRGGEVRRQEVIEMMIHPDRPARRQSCLEGCLGGGEGTAGAKCNPAHAGS